MSEMNPDDLIGDKGRQSIGRVLVLEGEIERLSELLRGVGANRYWEGRWRDADAEIGDLRARVAELEGARQACCDDYNRLRREKAELVQTVEFFSSVIMCGESWSAECEAALRSATKTKDEPT